MTELVHVLFAGPGGACLGIEAAGFISLGVELDPVACRTREAAGLGTIRGSVTDHNPEEMADNHGPAVGLWGSPPCQEWSNAGSGAARAIREAVLAAVGVVARGGDPDTAGWPAGASLILEPMYWLRWAYDIGMPYEWVILEQVPPALVVWHEYAKHLPLLGYSAVAANVQAEQYGVPQTRKRAILVARLGRGVALPAPTHSKYHSRDPGKLDAGVLKWVSIGEALPHLLDAEIVSNYGTGGDSSDRGVRNGDEPSATVTSKAGRNKIIFVSDNRPNTAKRGLDVPAPTILGNGTRGAHARLELVVGNQANQATRGLDEPSPTVTNWARSGRANLAFMPAGRSCPVMPRTLDLPAAAITGANNQVWVDANDYPADYAGTSPERRAQLPENQVTRKVTWQEAATLQTFPDGHPFQGNQGEIFRQVGDAVPPLLAQALVTHVTRED